MIHAIEVLAWLRNHGGQLRGPRRELRDQIRRAVKPPAPAPAEPKPSPSAPVAPASDSRPRRFRRRRRGRNLTHLVVSIGYAEMIRQVEESLRVELTPRRCRV